MEKNEKIKIGLVQINNSFFNQNYIPYSVGVIQAYSQKYVKNINDYEFLLPIYKRIKLHEAVDKLSPADIIFFSVYVWNFNLSREIAKKLKEIDKNKLIIFGGCHIPQRRIREFLIENPFIDIVCVGEGEIVAKSILENYNKKTWENVPSIAYRDKENKIIQNPLCERIKELDEIPSPYIAGIFKPLIDSVPNETWIALWETNRGCPFGCSYCEWGSNYQKRLYTYSLERLDQEIEWMSKNKIEFVFCCDSNFGMLKRDLEIAKKVAENKKKYGYPTALSVQNTKNSTEKSYNIMKVLAESGLSKGVNLAFQSLNPDTLNSVGRMNISNEVFTQLQKRFNLEGIETFSDIILGLPEETYESYTEGIDQLISNGQHNRIQFNNLSLLPNSEMGNREYQEKYGIKYVKSKMINIHGSLTDEEDIPEYQELVIATNKMPLNDWINARTFSYMIAFLHFDKILQLPFVILNKEYNVKYKDLTELFMNSSPSKYPIIWEIAEFFRRKSLDIQKGNEEFCKSEKWLNIWWPADELKIIELFSSGKQSDFYYESEKLIKELLTVKSIDYEEKLIKDAIVLNKNLIKLPLQKQDAIIELKYNIWEIYKANLTGKNIELKEEKIKYKIDKTTQQWESWEEWCQKVIWYGNKRGAYLYDCISLEEKNE